MTAANQHIEIDGGVLDAQADRAREVSGVFSSAANDVAAPLPEDAFGLLSRGLVVPLANALADRARELLDTARDLADRTATGIDTATAGFATVEQDAVALFSGTDA